MMNVKKVFIDFVLICLWQLQLETRAQTIEDRECVVLSQCPKAMKLIESKSLTPETIEFLRKSHCGFVGKEPKIWCDKSRNCLTPDFRKGTCKLVTECDPFLGIIRNADLSNQIIKKFLKQFRCNSELESKIQVCCPHDAELMHEVTVSKRNSDERAKTLLPNPEMEECGIQNSDNKIYDGIETNLDEFPWMALLKYRQRGKIVYACTGNLISSRYIVTAAHCINDVMNNLELFKVVLGEYDIRNKTDCMYRKFGMECAEPAQEFDIGDIIIHPEYKKLLKINDIALIRLKQKVRFSDYIRPICLPSKSLKLTGNETFKICGWGETRTQQFSSVKRKTTITYVNKTNCGSPSDKLICIGPGSCYGDSGGPLMLEQLMRKNYVTFLIGIDSYGYGRACGVAAEFYTYVPKYIDWIKKNTINQ